MKELEQILRLWAETEAAGQSAVLATVVETQGSSYRLPGARMLLTPSGERAGSISGGCLEEDLVKKAWWLTERGPMVRRYDTTPEGEIATTYGLGCNGIIHVLLERLEPGRAPVLDLIRTVRSERIPAAVVHVNAPSEFVGQRLTVGVRGEVSHNLARPDLVNLLETEARSALAEQSSRSVLVDDSVEVFAETLAPALRLLVFGAGDDAVPLTTLAKYLGWQVFVFDGRAHYARREKFPAADEVLVRPAGESGAETDEWTVAVLMSHSYSQDLANLRELSSRRLRYLGVLGPRKRTLQLLEDAGIQAEALIPGLHSPMGLDIGADGPEQVALSVLAEIQASLNGREGGPLRDRAGSIHAPAEAAADTESRWVQSIACA
jgi:xanthine dehydrogenase accessory factor